MFKCAAEEVGKVADLFADREERSISFLDISLCACTLRMGKKHFLIPFKALGETNAVRATLSRDRGRVTDALNSTKTPALTTATSAPSAATTAVHRRTG